MSIKSRDDRIQDMIRTRIAPSPTGFDLHIGNAYTALINFVFAKKNHGQFIVRIEDTDQARKVEGSEERILQTLDWLGLKADESPLKGGPYGPYRQSERKEIYQQYAHQLVKKGLAYYCLCSPERLAQLRQQQQKEGKPPRYDKACRAKNYQLVDIKDKKYVVRLKVPETGETCFDDLVRGRVCFKNSLIDDQVLLKSDGFPTYHLAVVVDDHLMKISHVIRAEEWLSSTPKHILLYQAFGWLVPQFAHLPILRNPDKSKLSKRKNPVWVSWYKEQGFLPEAINNYLLTLGWSHLQDKTIFSLKDAIEKFSFSRISKTGPIFDLVKLTWMNGEYIRMMNDDDLGEKIYSFLNKKYDRVILMLIIPLIKERIKKLSEAEGFIDFFFTTPLLKPEMLIFKNKSAKQTALVLEKVLDKFGQLQPWEVQILHKAGNQLVTETGWKPVELFQLIRIAVSGKKITPPLFESLVILGKEETIKRLQKASLFFPPSEDQPQQ